MTDPATLSEKREELKRQLAAGEYATLLDVFGYRTGRLIQKLTRKAKPIPFWYSILLVLLLLLLMGLLISSLFDEFNPTPAMFMIGGAVASYVGILIFKINQDIIILHLHDYIVDAITSDSDLADLQHWLGHVSDNKATIRFAMPFAFLATFPGLFFLSRLPGNFVGFGLIIQTIMSQILVGTGIYIFVLFSICLFASVAIDSSSTRQTLPVLN